MSLRPIQRGGSYGWLLPVGVLCVLVCVLSLWPPRPPPQSDMRPHPITPEHVRLQQQLQLVGALNDALDLQDGPRMRELIARYRQRDPQDENALAQGYERLADCLERPGAAARAAAQEYYDRERASTLRRYIRRTCLEPTGSAPE